MHLALLILLSVAAFFLAIVILLGLGSVAITSIVTRSRTATPIAAPAGRPAGRTGRLWAFIKNNSGYVIVPVVTIGLIWFLFWELFPVSYTWYLAQEGPTWEILLAGMGIALLAACIKSDRLRRIAIAPIVLVVIAGVMVKILPGIQLPEASPPTPAPITFQPEAATAPAQNGTVYTTRDCPGEYKSQPLDSNWVEVNPRRKCRVIYKITGGNVAFNEEVNPSHARAENGSPFMEYSLCPETGNDSVNWDCSPRPQWATEYRQPQ